MINKSDQPVSRIFQVTEPYHETLGLDSDLVWIIAIANKQHVEKSITKKIEDNSGIPHVCTASIKCCKRL